MLKSSTEDMNFNPNDLIDAENSIIQSQLELITLKTILSISRMRFGKYSDIRHHPL
ncbi:MAG: hypothetical protein HC887_10710 [Desulfobacteraceae bacterium]|nr:hypothetical protein [Desulfobacteraceae bacterium]